MDSGPNFEYIHTKKFKIALASISGLFTFFFLLFFQPFGVNNYRPDEKITGQLVIVLFIFAFLVALAILLLEFLVYHWIYLKIHSKKYMVWGLIVLVFTATTTFMFYNILGDFHDFYLFSYLKHIFEIGSILILPFMGVHFYFRHKNIIREYENILSLSKNHSKPNELILLKGDYKNDQIALAQNNIVFITSEDNYACLNFVEDNILKQYLIRSTLTNLEKKLDSSSIIRINRSQIVNINQLESYKVLSGSLKIKLKNTPDLFEASKSRQSSVLTRLINSSANLDSSLN